MLLFSSLQRVRSQHRVTQIAAWFLWDVALLGRLAPLPAVAAWLPGWIYDGVSKCGLTLASGEVLVASVVLVALGEVLLINSFLVCEYFASQVRSTDRDRTSSQYDSAVYRHRC